MTAYETHIINKSKEKVNNNVYFATIQTNLQGSCVLRF